MSLFLENRVLLDRFRSGEQQALLKVYQEYVSDVEALLRQGFTEVRTNTKIYGNSDFETQKELLQEIFIRAFSKSARNAYDGIRPYKTFLFTIARNVMIDHARKAQRDALRYVVSDVHEQVSSILATNDSEPHSEQCAQGTNEERLHWEMCLKEVDSFVSTLPSEMQSFVELRFFKEMPQRDIAKTLKITRWKARSWERKVISKLRKYLIEKQLL